MSTLKVATIQATTANTAPVFEDSIGTEIGTLCRAWASVDTTVATPNIIGSFNISSITDNAVGDITFNFTKAMPDTGYSSCATPLSSSNASWSYGYLTKTTSACRFRYAQIVSGSVSLIDTASFSLAVFR